MGFLDINHATKSYGAVKVLHETDISVEEGEFLVLVGPSGCGKSTLLNMIAGLEEVTTGDIAIKGRSMNGVKPAERNIAMVFQSYALYPNMTVRGNISFGMEMHGIPKEERDRKIDAVADLLQISPLLDRKPGQLSGGQRQRVAMGRALTRDPDVFLFDEPLSNLDAKLRVDMRTEIKKLHQKLGTTIVYVTHDQIEALTLSTRIAVMYAGHVQQLGTPKEVYDNPANMFVAGFMGSPSMNLFEAKVVSANGRPAAEVALRDGKTATLPFAGERMTGQEGRGIILGIRPEAITDRDGADRTSNAVHMIDAPVELTEPAGSDTFVVTQMGGRDITGRFRADVVVKAGETFPFAINMDKAVAFDPKTEERIASRVPPSPDIVIVGSGMGGATLAAGLAPTGARIVILERGEQIPSDAPARDPWRIYTNSAFRSDETWLDETGTPFAPGNYYNVGGNSKLYGAVLIRYRAEDFGEMAHSGGVSPAWPFGYDEIAPWYAMAERLYQVRGDAASDPTEPPHDGPYPHPPVPDEPALARVRERLVRAGVRPFTLPLGIDLERWLSGGATGWDGYPDTRSGKMDAETCGLAAALAHDNVSLITGARVTALVPGPDGRRISSVVYEKDGEVVTLVPGHVALCAGAVQSAALLLRSGVANAADQVGRCFMNHNASALIAVDPRFRNDAVYQKTFGINDWYLSDGAGGAPLGNVQLLGRVTPDILKIQVPRLPMMAARWLSAHAVDLYLISEDLPDPESRVVLNGDRIQLLWRRSNMEAHRGLVARTTSAMKAAGFPVVLSRLFDGRVPSHECGTLRIGADPATSVLDPECRSWDHPNLFVTDAGALPTSAAVNPALTVAALALRAARTIGREIGASGAAPA